jgi:hypothetical protein
VAPPGVNRSDSNGLSAQGHYDINVIVAGVCVV